MIKQLVIKMLNRKGFMRTMYPYANKQYGKFERYSTMNKTDCDASYVVAHIRILTHDIEKGFSLPEPRKGFGKTKLQELDRLLGIYEKNFMGYDDAAYRIAIATICYYKSCSEQYMLDISFLNDQRYQNNEALNCGVRICNKCELIRSNFENYYDFEKTRHSVRSYKNMALDPADVRKAIQGAQLAPSACNRQAVKVFHITGAERCKKVLNIQNGAKGFSEVNDVFVIAASLSSYVSPLESNTGFVDSGLFAMNFLLSLHSLGIGACPLLWNDETDRAEQLRSIAPIPECYEIALIVPAGYYTDIVKYAVSPRKPIELVYEKV